ncbi:hypothetical protein [Leisingera sp.]|uniref:hypothetical protein n=1 Tax=Leisingera sp. TaxID=1879318 RepID=UPI002B26F33C|nr:hypothetical protein [Leisingera sp.]
MTAKVRIGNHTPDLRKPNQFTEQADLTLMAGLPFKYRVGLSALAALPKLEKLALVNITAPDLAPLARLPQLKRLSLDSVRVSEFTPLTRLTQSEHLSVWGAVGLPAGTLQPLLEVETLRIVYTGPVSASHRRLLGKGNIAQYLTGTP